MISDYNPRQSNVPGGGFFIMFWNSCAGYFFSTVYGMNPKIGASTEVVIVALVGSNVAFSFPILVTASLFIENIPSNVAADFGDNVEPVIVAFSISSEL